MLWVRIPSGALHKISVSQSTIPIRSDRRHPAKGPPCSTVLSLTEAWELFTLECRCCLTASSTIYRWRLQPFIVHCTESGVTTLDGIDARRYGALHGDLSEYSHAAASAIRRWLNFCVAEELLDASPMRKVKPTLNRLSSALSDVDIRHIIATCHIRRDKAIVYIRSTPACAADWSASTAATSIYTPALSSSPAKGARASRLPIAVQPARAVAITASAAARPIMALSSLRTQWPAPDCSGLFRLMRRLRSSAPNCKPHIPPHLRPDHAAPGLRPVHAATPWATRMCRCCVVTSPLATMTPRPPARYSPVAACCRDVSRRRHHPALLIQWGGRPGRR